MVALAKISKKEIAAQARVDYIAYATASMILDGDERGAFAIVPSQSHPSETHKVHISEPTKGAAIHATFCDCIGYDYRAHCVHTTDIVNAYFAKIYTAMHPVMVALDTQVTMPFPIGNDDMDALVARLEAEFGLVESPKKPRRSAPNEALVARLQVAKKVSIAQVRKASNVYKVSPKCPVVVAA